MLLNNYSNTGIIMNCSTNCFYLTKKRTWGQITGPSMICLICFSTFLSSVSVTHIYLQLQRFNCLYNMYLNIIMIIKKLNMSSAHWIKMVLPWWMLGSLFPYSPMCQGYYSELIQLTLMSFSWNSFLFQEKLWVQQLRVAELRVAELRVYF